MKTCEEMAANVLARRNAYRIKRRKQMKQMMLCLALAVALGTGYAGTARPETPQPVQTTQPGQIDVVIEPPQTDTRAETWQTAEELGFQPQGVMGGFAVRTFLAYKGGFYGIVETDRMDDPRFALSEEEDLLFNTHYTRKVYLVEGQPDQIAIHINGMEVYEKLFDVTFELEGRTWAIAWSPVMNADYGLGEAVLETGDFTVYEAVRLQGEPAETKEYIVDILPILERELPNLFGPQSEIQPEEGGHYAEQYQLAWPVK